MVIFPSQFDQYTSEIGSKTKNLKKLMDHGFRVPPFRAIPSSALQKNPDELAANIQEKLPYPYYAVRSSALIEDTEKNSFAGQFKTKIKQAPDQLSTAIIEVVTHASTLLGGSLENFSLIIQEYVEADYAGVCFTRNPLGGREMVLEYHAGIGEDIVGGKIKPLRQNLYWHQPKINVPLPAFQDAFESFKKIEILFGKAQDIEWCIKDGAWYFLQTRTITSIAQDNHEEFIFLDEHLPRGRYFFFEKTEISEIAPRPTPFTLSLLKMIYGQDGPIEKVYSRFGVQYMPREFLKIIGNELYVDREEEIKTLLPSYSYFPNFKPGWAGIKGFFRTLKNIFAFHRISLKRYYPLVEMVKQKLTQSSLSLPFSKALQQFLEEYEIIFEINLLAEKAIKALERLLKKEPIALMDILAISKGPAIDFDHQNWTGNCLEISDVSEFVKFQQKNDSTGGVNKWYGSLATHKKKFFTHFLENAQNFNKLREYGRYLTVKNVNRLRTALTHEAKKMSFPDPALIYFATLAEIHGQSFSETVCLERKKKYEEYIQWNFPSKLMSTPYTFANKLLGVSKGKARGKLVTADKLSSSKNNILYTQILSPDLTQYFSKIEGIVSESGGLLSHLAIMAREKGIPIIVNFDLKHSAIQLGDQIEINADEEKILKISDK